MAGDGVCAPSTLQLENQQVCDVVRELQRIGPGPATGGPPSGGLFYRHCRLGCWAVHGASGMLAGVYTELNMPTPNLALATMCTICPLQVHSTLLTSTFVGTRHDFTHRVICGTGGVQKMSQRWEMRNGVLASESACLIYVR